MKAIQGTEEGAMPGTKSIGLVTITATEGTRGIRLRRGLGRGNATRSVVGMTTLTTQENTTETEETRETDPERAMTEIILDLQSGMSGRSNTHGRLLPKNDTQKTLTYSLPLDQEQIDTRKSTKTLTTQANQIVKSFSGV